MKTVKTYTPKDFGNLTATLTERTLKGTTKFKVSINWMEEREHSTHGIFLYFGYTPIGPDRHAYGLWGYGSIHATFRPDFGIVNVNLDPAKA